MFNFINEFGLKKELCGYKYVNLNGEKVFVQGFVSLLCFEENRVILKLKNEELEVCGDKLNIEELGVNSMLICGKIKSVKVD